MLQRSVSQDPNRHFTTPELNTLFKEYQTKRYERVKRFVDLSGSVTRMRSYNTLWQRFFIGYIATLPFMINFQGSKFLEGFAKGPKLEYAKTRTINEDAEGWQLAKKGETKGGSGAYVIYAILTSAVGVGLSYAAAKWGRSL